jgi:beta-glucanase (GH16 family)
MSLGFWRTRIVILLSSCLVLSVGWNCRAAEDVVFAHVVAGGGFSTTFTLTNTGTAAVSGSLTLTDQTGNPLPVNWSTTTTAASVPVTVPAGGTAILTASGAPGSDVKSGWARVQGASNGLVGVASFQFVNSGALKTIAGVLSSAPLESAGLPVDNDSEAERFSGFAVANPGSSEVRVSLTTFRPDGSIADVLSPPELNPLSPNSQVARFLHEYLPSRATFRGSLILAAEGGAKVSVVALSQNHGLYTAVPVMARKPAWRLVWSDEFDGPDGAEPDAVKWGYDVGGGGWGNNELEYHTSRRSNSYLQAGNLVIKAISETYTGPDNVTRSYTSARLKTQGKYAQKYGRIEARLKVPQGQGIWPAFWMLGDNIDTAKWPACGEIDIMENIGKEPSIVHGTAHGPGYSGGSGIGKAFTLSGGRKFADDFHVFTIEWDPEVIRWFVDGEQFFSVTPASLPSGARWVFDHPHFIILNVAVGGGWPGYPDQTTVFPQMMLVDYVRIFERVP